MTTISYHYLEVQDIHEDLLKNFERYSSTSLVRYIDPLTGHIRIKEDHFIDDWSREKLLSIASYLKTCVGEGGSLLVAKQGNQLVGFTCLEAGIFGTESKYLNLPYIHVDKRFRGHGIGRELMYHIKIRAKEMGADKLYIAAHPSVESQAFYDAMGCRLSLEINQKILAYEPLDLQLELELYSESPKAYLENQSP